MTKYLSLLYLVACIPCVNAQVADKITVIGNDQTTNPSPSSFSQEVRFHVKWNGSIGVPHIGSPGPGTYSALMSIAPWSDGSGPKHHQLNFNEDGLFWRKGAFGSAWEPWKRIVTADENGNVGIGLTNPSFALSINAVENQTVLGGNTKSAIRIMNGYAEAFGRRSEIQFGLSQLSNELLAVIAAEYSSWNGYVGGDLLFGTTPTSSSSIIERMRINRDGFVGIGTPSPAAKLDISGDNADLSILKLRNSTWACNQRTTIEFWNGAGKNYPTSRIVSQMDGCGAEGEALLFETQTAGASSPSPKLIIKNDGSVGIGTTTPGSFKLAVNGKIWTQEVNVAMTNPGPDYVFEKDYDLLSLTELETYITQHKHLPEVPSAKEMEANGLNLKEMNLLLLKKVEELTLHLIEMKKENNGLKTRIESLENKK